jgi:hypothetical protein
MRTLVLFVLALASCSSSENRCGGLGCADDVVSALAADGSYIYYATQARSVGRVAKKGGDTNVLPVANVSGGGLASIEVSGPDIFLKTGGLLFHVPKEGGAAVEIGQARAFAVDAVNLYYAGDNLVQQPRDGGAPIVLADGTHVGSIAVGGGWVYWANSLGFGGVDADFGLWRAPIGGGTAQQLVQGSGLDGILLDGDRLYWCVDGSSVRASSLDGSGVTQWANPCPWVISNGELFGAVNCPDAQICGSPPATIWRAPFGGRMETVVTESSVVTALTVDDQAIYWSAGDRIASQPLN